MTIEPGHQYLLDGKTPVIVIKPVNRAKTIYSVEVERTSVVTVEATRLQAMPMAPKTN